MSVFNHYPNLAEFKPLSRSETEGFDGAPLPLAWSSAGPFPHHNYFYHVYPWDPYYIATESDTDLRFPSPPAYTPRVSQRVSQQTSFVTENFGTFIAVTGLGLIALLLLRAYTKSKL